MQPKLENFVGARARKPKPTTKAVRSAQAAAPREIVQRATYFLRPDQVMNVKITAIMEEKQVSALVREAVDAYLADRPSYA